MTAQNFPEYLQKQDIIWNSCVFHYALWCCPGKSKSSHITDFQIFVTLFLSTYSSPSDTPLSPPQIPYLPMKSKYTLKIDLGSIFWKCKERKSISSEKYLPHHHVVEGKFRLVTVGNMVLIGSASSSTMGLCDASPPLSACLLLSVSKVQFCTVGRTGAEWRHLEQRK